MVPERNAAEAGPGRRVLVHVCCAACWLGLAEDLSARGLRAEGFFHNPNIHPLLEFRRRLKAVRLLAHDTRLTLHADGEYGLTRWLREVVGNEDRRCEICYHMRLTRTAERARDEGFDAFTTTMLVSPQQQHDLLRSLGEELARSVGVAFLYHDWRASYEAGGSEAKRRRLYRQQYCGCIYSEYERYRDTGKHLWRPPEGF
jgi:hypothetical protein